MWEPQPLATLRASTSCTEKTLLNIRKKHLKAGIKSYLILNYISNYCQHLIKEIMTACERYCFRGHCNGGESFTELP
jgi:hypothetical protein